MKSVVSELHDHVGKAFEWCHPSEDKGHWNNFGAAFV